jgi:hypothetical protein
MEKPMMDRRKEIAGMLGSAADDTVRLFASLSPQELQAPVYTDEVRWNARQVLAHLVTIEKSMHRLFRDMLAGGPGSPEDFDVTRFNRTQPRKLDALSIEDLIGRFRSVRKETIAIVEAMSDADLDREGRHVFLGHGRLEGFIRWAYEHARLHEDDVRRALQNDP